MVCNGPVDLALWILLKLAVCCFALGCGGVFALLCVHGWLHLREWRARREQRDTIPDGIPVIVYERSDAAEKLRRATPEGLA